MRSLLLALLLLPATLACADDWPQWMGPDGDGVYHETGVVESIPAEGLPVRWTAEVAHGYAGPSVAGGRVFLFDYVIDSGEVANLPSRRDKLSGQERLTAFDARSGELLWRESYPRDYAVSYGGGPRCTPTVDGDHVYTLGAEGDLVCRQVADGKLVWRKHFKTEYAVETPIWGYAAHPQVIDDMVVCMVGGEGTTVVAFDKRTGAERWSSLTAGEPGYCPVTLIEHNGARQLLAWHPESLNALVPETGDLIWSLPARPSYGMSVTRPQKDGDKIYIGAVGNISVLMQLRPDGSDVDVLWAGNAKSGVRTSNATGSLRPGVIYGVDCETSELMAVDVENGERLWTTTAPTFGDQRGRYGTAFLVRSEGAKTDLPSLNTGHYFLFNELGELISAELSEKGYTEQGRMKVLEQTSSSFGRPVVWSHPAFADRALFARNDKQLVCVDLSE